MKTPLTDADHKKLFRSRSNKVVGGVFGGLGQYSGIDPTVYRFIWIVITVLTGFVPGVVAYLVAMFIIPMEPVAAEKG